MPVLEKKVVTSELREQVKHSIIISEKPLLGSAETETPGGAKSSEGRPYYIYSTRPELFDDIGPTPKYLGYVAIQEGTTKDIKEKEGIALAEKHNVKETDMVADMNDFYPLESIGTKFDEMGVGGRVLDLILKKLSDDFDWVICFSTRPKMVRLLESRGFQPNEDGDGWIKKLE